MPSYDDFESDFDELFKNHGKRYPEGEMYKILKYHGSQFVENLVTALADSAFRAGYQDGFREAYNLSPEDRLKHEARYKNDLQPSKEFIPEPENVAKIMEALKINE